MARASAEILREKGASVAILDLPTSAGADVASSLGGSFHPVDVTDDDSVERALADAAESLGGIHIAVNTAGGGTAVRTLGKEGPHPLAEFRRVIELNLIATFNLNRLQALHMSRNEPEDGERGVIIDTASIAAFEGQIGQVAYTAAKAGIAGMMLTMARDLGSLGIRVGGNRTEPVQHGHHSGDTGRVRRSAHERRRVPQAHGTPRGIRPARRSDRGDPHAQRLHNPPRRRAALRTQVTGVAGRRQVWAGVASKGARRTCGIRS